MNIKINRSDIPERIRKKTITINKSEFPDIEPIIEPDSKKHRRIRIVLYLIFSITPIILLVLFGGSIGHTVLWVLVSTGIINGCVRPKNEWRITKKKKNAQQEV